MKKNLCCLYALLTFIFIVSCAKQEVDSSKIFSVYYINNSETKIQMHEHYMDANTPEGQVEELLTALGTISERLEYKSPLSMGFSLLDYEIEDGKIQLNVSDTYRDLSVTSEVLVRAAIVRTLTQLPSINFVAISIEASPLVDTLGNLVGWMNADYFIENEGNEINTYEEVRLKLYFANEAGDRLLVTNRTKEYNTNISMEKLIIEELIKGPNAEGIYPTINPSTKVASVTVRDGVCYVNLDENFMTQIYNVTADVTIFSITNSLVELSNVNKVQISINGDNTGLYREKYGFSTYFERNLDIVDN